MNFFRTLHRSYVPEILVFLIFALWATSIFFGLKSYQSAMQAHLLDPNLPVPSFQWGRHLPGLFFILFFISIRLRQRKAFKQ